MRVIRFKGHEPELFRIRSEYDIVKEVRVFLGCSKDVRIGLVH